MEHLHSLLIFYRCGGGGDQGHAGMGRAPPAGRRRASEVLRAEDIGEGRRRVRMPESEGVRHMDPGRGKAPRDRRRTEER